MTGTTGFVGSLLLRDILEHRRRFNVGKILLLSRPKRGKTAASRYDAFFDPTPMPNADPFSLLGDVISREEFQNIVTVLEGDVLEPGFGLSEADSEVRGGGAGGGGGLGQPRAKSKTAITSRAVLALKSVC
jgi:thioester reductase-like protein